MNNQTEAAAKKRYSQKVALGFVMFAVVVAIVVLMSSGEGKKETAPISPQQVDERQGLSKAQRQEIYQAPLAAEARARADTDVKQAISAGDLASVDRNALLSQELVAKYHAEVREKYDITEDQQWAIATEGVAEQWPRE